MEVKKVIGKGVPLSGDDIDTDRIIPARFLRCVTFDGLGDQVFADDRTQTGGKHPFDLPQYQGANLLVVNDNFGCGSSREHAPQALAKWGIKAVIGESFAEIFFGNCTSMGIPCLSAAKSTVKKLQEILTENPDTTLTLDLEALEVRCGDFVAEVSIGSGARSMLITGTWDSCGQLVNNVADISKTATKLPYLQWG